MQGNGDSTRLRLFEAIIDDEEQVHFNYFNNVDDHIEKLGDRYPAQTTGTPSAPVYRLRALLPDSAPRLQGAEHDVDRK